MPRPADTDVVALKSRLRRNQRLLGLDVGEKTIGLALSDVNCTISTAYDTIRRTKFTKDAERLARIISENDIGGLVIGLPVNMDGSEGPRCQSVREFARNLAQKIELPVAFWDERLSTVAAERRLLDADMSRAKRAKVIDQVAAAHILQGALDRIREAG